VSVKDDPLEKGLGAFFAAFRTAARRFTWTLNKAAQLRCNHQGTELCPLMALGLVRSDMKEIPDHRNMAAAAGVADSVAAAVVHLADGISTSRYWTEARRGQLLALVRIEEYSVFN
jgi:hypothetical protein